MSEETELVVILQDSAFARHKRRLGLISQFSEGLSSLASLEMSVLFTPLREILPVELRLELVLSVQRKLSNSAWVAWAYPAIYSYVRTNILPNGISIAMEPDLI